MDKETITPEGASFLLLQTTELDIQYGDDYKLQKLEGSHWVDVPIIIDDYAFHAIAYELPKDKPQTLEIGCIFDYTSCS